MPHCSFSSIVKLGKHDHGVTSVCISRQEQRVFSSSSNGTIREWPTGRTFVSFQRVRLYRGSDPVQPYCISLAVNDKYLICGMHHGTVEVYSLADGHLIQKLHNPIEKSSYQYNFHTVTAHPADSDIIAGSNGSYLVVWSAQDGKIVWRETSFRLINSVRFLRGGHILMAHEWDPWIHVWDFETRKRIRWETTLMDTSANWVSAAEAPAGGSKLDFVLSTEDADDSALVGANLDASEPVWQGLSEARIHAINFLPDGCGLLTGGDAGKLELWNTSTADLPQQIDLRTVGALAGEFGEPPRRKQQLILTTPVLDGSYPPWTIHCVAVAPDGSFGIAGLANGLVLRIDILS
jgi:WD40 repeat protein